MIFLYWDVEWNMRNFRGCFFIGGFYKGIEEGMIFWFYVGVIGNGVIFFFLFIFFYFLLLGEMMRI